MKPIDSKKLDTEDSLLFLEETAVQDTVNPDHVKPVVHRSSCWQQFNGLKFKHWAIIISIIFLVIMSITIGIVFAIHKSPPAAISKSILDKNYCSKNPCQNGGQCFDVNNNFKCECLPNWLGKTCAEEIIKCSSNPCSVNGNCVDKEKGFFCNCKSGWRGNS